MITVNQEIVEIIARVESNQIVCEQIIPQIIVQGGQFVVSIVPFTAQATVNNQTVFTLLGPNGQPLTAFTTIICLFIMGAGQNILASTPDYTVSGNQVTLSQGISLGYTIFGSVQI